MSIILYNNELGYEAPIVHDIHNLFKETLNCVLNIESVLKF